MSNLPGKTVKSTAIEDHTYRIFSNDLNSYGTVFGGLVMSIIDRTALVVAERHSGHTCVTASVDAMHFLAPAGKGDNLIFKASVNRTWNTSIEIGVRVVAEHSTTREKTHIVSAYFTFVALDNDKKPTRVPPVLPETKIEKRRYEEAQIRKEFRLKQSQQIEEKRSRESLHE
ncbi:MAG: acyl-CoA thioesterase [Chlamydiales bacterium]|nr:acyl-CoA thioesterase [Chlamydiales bacterium]